MHLLTSYFVSRDLAGRDIAIDTFRGLAVIGMILVNHAPPTDQIYSIFVHPEWSGWSLADTIFPAFLFLVGVSINLSMSRGIDANGRNPPDLIQKIIRRTLLLMVLNFLLVNFPYYEPSKLELDGTLARIGWCYLFASLIFLNTGRSTWLYIVIAIIVGQWIALEFLDVPGFGPGVITPEGNASGYIDEIVFGQFAVRLQHGGPVTQGVMPILASVASTVIGVIAGDWLKSSRKIPVKIAGLFVAGAILVVLGISWGHWYEISKPLWTGSYLVLMAGVSMQLLATIYWFADYCEYDTWTVPFQVAGVNALFFYVFAQCMQRVLVYGRLSGDDGASIRFRYFIYDQWIAPWAPGKGGALLYAMGFLLVCYTVVLVLYRKKIFIKL